MINWKQRWTSPIRAVTSNAPSTCWNWRLRTNQSSLKNKAYLNFGSFEDYYNPNLISYIDYIKLCWWRYSFKENFYTIYIYMLENRKRIIDNPDHEFGLVIDGQSLALAMKHNKQLLSEVSSVCRAVVCCRMSPIQKAEVRFPKS